MSSEIPQPCFVALVSRLSDPRQHRIQHPLVNIITIVVMGVLCGEEGWEDYAEFAQDRIDFLEQFLDLSAGIPSPDTLRRVLERIDGSVFTSIFLEWIEHISPRLPGQICIDGKTLKKAKEKGSALHIVSAWAEANHIVLGSQSSNSKGKEIPCTEELLKLLVLHPGDIVSMDAMGCQRKLLKKIHDKRADYLVAVKKNQGLLYDEIENDFSEGL